MLIWIILCSICKNIHLLYLSEICMWCAFMVRKVKFALQLKLYIRMFISILIYFELKYFVSYGKITSFWVLLQVLLQEMTTILMLFLKRFVILFLQNKLLQKNAPNYKSSSWYWLLAENRISCNFEKRTSLAALKCIWNDFISHWATTAFIAHARWIIYLNIFQ